MKNKNFGASHAIPNVFSTNDFTFRPAVDRKVALQACLEAQIAGAVPRLAAELHRSSMRWTDGIGGLGLEVFEVMQLVELKLSYAEHAQEWLS